MKVFLPLAMVACTGVFSSLAAPQGAPPITIPLADYFTLLSLCRQGGSDVYVGVRYSDTSLVTFKFAQCYPYQLANGALAQQAVFCRSVTCYNNPNPDCTGGAVPPVPVPVVAGLTLPNVADFVQLLGQGATCQKNGLSGILL